MVLRIENTFFLSGNRSQACFDPEIYVFPSSSEYFLDIPLARLGVQDNFWYQRHTREEMQTCLFAGLLRHQSITRDETEFVESRLEIARNRKSWNKLRSKPSKTLRLLDRVFGTIS